METRLRIKKLIRLDQVPLHGEHCCWCWGDSRAQRRRFPLHDEHGWFLGRADLYYPERRLVIEYDGAAHRDSLATDNRRQNRLVDAGYRVLRFTAWDVLGSPDSVLDLVRRAHIEGREGLR